MRLQHAFAEDFGYEAHHGFEAGVFLQKGIDAVKRQPRPAPVAPRLRVGEGGGGVGQALFARQSGAGEIEGFDLHVGHAALFFVGAGEMAGFDDGGHFAALHQRGVGGGVVMREEAGAVHAGIHFQPHGNGRLPVVAQQAFELPLAADHRPQIEPFHFGVFFGLEHAFEQDDGVGDAVFAQQAGFFEKGDGESVGNVGQRVGAAQRAVAVGVGFEHRQHAAAVNLFEGSVVFAQAVEADFGAQRSHGGCPSVWAGTGNGRPSEKPCARGGAAFRRPADYRRVGGVFEDVKKTQKAV